MERKLIANYLVPDDEVWVSPATWERPFSLKAKESTVTTHNSAMVPLADVLEVLHSHLPARKTNEIFTDIKRCQQHQ